ncbi:MAG TPA: OmpA family protein [Rhodopila sp.]|nr:OmpA family protein [Rhodopila sp.]
MKYRSVSLAAMAMAMAMALAAQAQPVTGFYIGGGAGYNLPENPPLTPRGHILPDNGFAGLGSVGYGLGNGFRFELEGNYRNASLPAYSDSTISSNKGHLDTYGVMANALFDFDIGLPWVYPYAGGGVGYAFSDFSRQRTFTAAASPLVSQNFDQTVGSFAFQAIGGLSFPIPGVPGLSATAEYRFFGVPGSETFSGSDTVSGFPGPAAVSIKVQHQYDHSFLIGVRYAFGAPPPVAPGVSPEYVQAPTPARSYLLFFDWDKATLTTRAQQIVKEAADNATKVQYTRIDVNGYTDTSGTPQYNKGLSIRRGQAVAVELVKDGVPKAAIAIQGFGETHLLVSTGPGVREPQNRRVEIIIH